MGKELQSLVIVFAGSSLQAGQVGMLTAVCVENNPSKAWYSRGQQTFSVKGCVVKV